MGPDGPQYTMGGKVVEMRREGAPGPGQYELRVESGPGVKIGKETKESRDMTTRREVPGPGQYDQAGHYNGSVSNNPKISFSKSSRSHSMANVSPGRTHIIYHSCKL